MAQTAPVLDLNFLANGKPWSPFLWSSFRQTPIPPVDGSNGPKVTSYIQQGKLALSLSEFLHLVAENSLSLSAARYNYLIAQVDLQRARSGQAARGVPGFPVPGAFFAGAIGAGLGNITNVANQGTGGTSISGGARQVFIGPRGTSDPTLSVNVSFDHVISPLNSTRVAGISTVAIPSAVLQTRFQQELPWGLGYSLDFNMQHQTTTQKNILYNPAFTSYFGLQVYQPLLNGSGRAFTHRFVNLAENDLRYAFDSVEVAMTDALTAAALAYWDFVGFKDRQRVAERALELDQRMYDAVKARIEVGVQPRTELAAAALQVAASRRDLILAQTNVQLQEVRLKSLMTKLINPEIVGIRFEPTDTLEGLMQVTLPPLDEALKAAGRKPPVRQARYSLENHKIAETFTRSALRPTMSIVGEFSNHSLAPGLGGMFGQTLQSKYPEFAIGVAMSFSVKNRAAQADNLRARMELKQAEAVLEQATENMTLNIRTSMTNVTPARSAVEAAQQAVAASQQTADAEQERWATGVSTLDKVYQTQKDLVRSQIAEIQSRVNYAHILTAAESAAGTSLIMNGIVVADVVRGNLWKDPAVK